MPRKFHTHVCMHPPQSEDRLPRIVCRDCLVILNMQAVLRSHGYEDGDPIVELALRPGAKPRNRTPIEQRYGPDDVILVATRFPLHDDEELLKTKKHIKRVYTPLENHELEGASGRFETLTRAYLVLQPELRPLLPPGFETRSHIEFYQRMFAPIKKLHGGEKGKRGVQRKPSDLRTTAFVLNLRELWPGGPALHSVFAMDSATAVGWSGILRYRHPDWALAPGFRMVELTLTRLPDYIEDTRFGLEWKEETLLYVEE